MNASALWCAKILLFFSAWNQTTMNDSWEMCIWMFNVYVCVHVCVYVLCLFLWRPNKKSNQILCLHSLSIFIYIRFIKMLKSEYTSDLMFEQAMKTNKKMEKMYETNLNVRHFGLDFDRPHSMLQWHAKQAHLLRRLAVIFLYWLKLHHHQMMNWLWDVTVVLDAN